MLFLAAFILALLISLLFLPSYKSRGASVVSLIFFFFILFMAGLATQFWIVPFGPVVWGVSWLPLLFMLLIFTFLFAIPSPYQRRVRASDKTEKDASDFAAVTIFTWLLLFMLLIALAVGFYYYDSTT